MAATVSGTRAFRCPGGRWLWDGCWRFVLDPSREWEMEVRAPPRPPTEWRTRAVAHEVLGLVAYPTVAGERDFGVLDFLPGGITVP